MDMAGTTGGGQCGIEILSARSLQKNAEHVPQAMHKNHEST